MELKELHEEVFKFMLEQHKKNPDLTFLLRDVSEKEDSNLKLGYWFYNKSNAALKIVFIRRFISRTPSRITYSNTLSFIIELTGNTSLFIEETDVELQQFWASMTPILGLQKYSPNTFRKQYQELEYLKSLEYFLQKELPVINSLLNLKDVKKYHKIPESTLSSRLEKINKIRHDITKLNFENTLKDRLFIKSLHLSNIALFKNITFSFEKQITCIIGTNGVGKTTLLKAIALGLVGATSFSKEDLQMLTIESYSNSVKYALEGDITVDYQLHEKPCSHSVIFKAKDQGSFFKVENIGENILGEDDILKAPLFVFPQQIYGYDTKDIHTGLSPHLEDVFPIIKNKHKNRFYEFTQWVTSMLNYEESKQDVIGEVNRVIGNLINDNDLFIFEEEGFMNEIHKEGLPINLISQGYKNVILWVGILMKRLWEYHQTLPLYTDIPFTQLPAVCLIDEIDTYLHPNWQYNILKGLAESFPNVQFIITTHSPFALTSVPFDKITIYELSLEGKEIVAKEVQENLYGADANRVTDVMSEERLPEIKQKFVELKKLINGNQLDAAEAMLANDFVGIKDADPDIVAANSRIRTKRLFQKK